MKTINWSEYSPEEICNAFNSIPDIAMPWVKDYNDGETTWERKSLKENSRIAGIVQSIHRNGDVMYIYGHTMRDECDTLEMAQKIVDKTLVEKNWILMQ